MFAATGIPYMPEAGEKVPQTGSLFRGGRNVVGFGATDTSIAAGATEEITIPIRERGVLGHFVVGAAAAELTELIITSIKLNNDELISGEVPAAMFAADAVRSPAFGHRVNVSDQLTVSVKNTDGTNASSAVGIGFSVG